MSMMSVYCWLILRFWCSLRMRKVDQGQFRKLSPRDGLLSRRMRLVAATPSSMACMGELFQCEMLRR
jgi:hypothetical protein